MSLLKHPHEVSSSSKPMVGRSSLWSRPHFSLRQYALVIAGLLILAGGIILLAATPSPFASITADKGTLTSGATVKSPCSGSSDGSCVVFGSASGSGATISPNPDGPPPPTGDSWSVVYGDAFNAPILGTPQATGSGIVDSTWWPNGDSGTGLTGAFNSNELERFGPSQVSVDSGGMELTCTAGGNPMYLCGQAQGRNVPSGSRPFGFNYGHGQTWAVQVVTKWPKNTG